MAISTANMVALSFCVNCSLISCMPIIQEGTIPNAIRLLLLLFRSQQALSILLVCVRINANLQHSLSKCKWKSLVLASCIYTVSDIYISCESNTKSVDDNSASITERWSDCRHINDKIMPQLGTLTTLCLNHYFIGIFPVVQSPFVPSSHTIVDIN